MTRPDFGETAAAMTATLDLNTIFNEVQFDDLVLASLKELAFAGSESLNRFRTLLSELEHRASSAPDGAAAQALKLGACYHLVQDHEKTDRWLAAAPAGAMRSFLMGQAARERGRFDEALSAFEEAARLGRDQTECDLQRAETLIVAGRTEEAVGLVDAHASAVELAQWHYLKGRLAQVVGAYAEAAEFYERAIELDEEHPEALFHLANLAHLLGDDEMARQLYQDCANLPFVYVNALINLAILHEDEGEYDEAESSLRRVLATNPDHWRAQLYLKDVSSATKMYFDEQQARIQEQCDAIMDIPVTDFELSVRARNCLKKMNIFTLGDLLRTTERELLAYKNFGETSLKEIKAMLTQKGLQIGQYAAESLEEGASASTAAQEPPAGNPELLARSVANLQLSVRARKCLQRLGIETIGQLVSATESELLASKNFGQTSLNEIKQRLEDIGLNLRVPK
ncbi:MAG: DNA-directed RNA polymerase subunit alpha C-terminal domain-containing protein [Phycisphaerae bacterium]